MRDNEGYDTLVNRIPRTIRDVRESAYEPARIIKRRHRSNIVEIRQFARNWVLRISKINQGDKVSVRGKIEAVSTVNISLDRFGSHLTLRSVRFERRAGFPTSARRPMQGYDWTENNRPLFGRARVLTHHPVNDRRRRC